MSSTLGAEQTRMATPAQAALASADAGVQHSTALVVLRPSGRWVPLGLGELWRYRELLFFLVWRDVKVRYKQTALGAAWAILQPMLTMVVFTIFFGRLAGVPSDGLPYPVFAYTALIPWTFFASGLTQSADSLVGAANLLRKVYFPRLAIPVATVLAGGVDFLLSFSVLVVLMASYGIAPTWQIVWLPALMLLALATALGTGLWLSALNVQFRDVRYVVPFIVQVWMFATPIAYPSTLLEEPWRTVYGLNPMVGVVEGFRWALLGTQTAPGPMLGVSSANRATLEARYELFLYAFDRHLAAHPFLLGGRPSIGDFGLMGPLYAVLSRDPYPAELMRRIAPRVVDWVERMNHPPQTFGPWCPDDQVPVTLDPIFEALFTDMWPMIEATVRAVTAWVQANPERPRLSRFVGKHELVIGDTIASRRAQSLTQWMAQRPLEHYHGLAMTARPAVDIWLERVGGWEAMQLEIPTWLRRCEDNRLAVIEPPL